MADDLQDISAVVGIAVGAAGLWYLFKSQQSTGGGGSGGGGGGGTGGGGGGTGAGLILSGRGECVTVSGSQISHIVLTWSAPAGLDAAGYDILRDNSIIDTVYNTKSWNSLPLSAAQQGQAHDYKVITKVAAGQTPLASNAMHITSVVCGGGSGGGGTDLTVSALHATQVGSYSYDLSWQRVVNRPADALEFLDVSQTDGSFAPGSFLGFDTSQTLIQVNGNTVTIKGVNFNPGDVWWRVNTFRNGVWYTSPVAHLVAVALGSGGSGGDFAAENLLTNGSGLTYNMTWTRNALPGFTVGWQAEFFDISQSNGGFAPGDFLGFDTSQVNLSVSGNVAQINGVNLASFQQVWWRINTLINGQWYPSPVFSFYPQ